MFHNISNPKWFGNWSRLEDDYLGNGGTDMPPALGRWPASPSTSTRCRFPISRT